MLVAPSLATASSSTPASITSVRQQVDTLEAELAAQQREGAALSQRFDAVQERLVTLDADVVRLRGEIQHLTVRIAVTQKQLQTDAVLAYVYSGQDSRSLSMFTQDANQNDALGVYESTVIGDISAVEAAYTVQKDTLLADRRNLRAQGRAVGRAVRRANELRWQNHILEVKTNHELATMSTTLRHLVLEAAIQAAREAAEASEAAAAASAAGVAGQLGGEAGSTAATYGFSGSINGTATGNTAGLAAFAAAKSQIGVPYVWGGEDPGVGFDCSGLTQWAWAQAGVSIPRTAAEQWESLPHVSLQHLQPGDLLFYYNLDGDDQVDHVVMYGGSGPWGTQTTIAAAYTGTDISLAPAFTYGLIGAAQP